MSATSCLAYYGLRFEVERGDRDALEARSDPRMLAAMKAGLKHYWANFAAPGERYVLFIGAQLAILGPEGQAELAVPSGELSKLMEATKAKLLSAGFTGEPSLYLQWEPDA